MSKRDDNLFYEASEGKDARLMKSLDHGANPNEANNWGQLPLHYASVRGNFKSVAILLGRGSNVNHQDSQGNTTLHYSAKRNQPHIVGLLRDWGADATLKNVAGQTALDLATGERVKQILERMMVMDSADPTERRKKLMESIQQDSALNPMDANGDTVLHQYVMTAKIKKVQKLLDKGVDPNCANRSSGDTPLHLAVKQGDPKMAILLIENNAYINAQNKEGKTPLHYSCIFQKDVLLHILLDYQADISILTNDGMSAMNLIKTKKGARLLSVARTRCEPKTHKVIGDYILGQTLGTGSFAKVKVATHMKTKQKYAIKIVQKKSLEAEDVERLSREIHIMRILNHSTIVEFHDHFESERNIYLVMELVSGVDLFDYIYENDPIPEPVVKKIFSQMIEGLGFIHQFGIVHRDLKPENLLVNLDDLEVKIIDFGLSNVQQKLIFETACGSPHYVAPEVLMGRSYGPEVDIWSMGVILHVMLFGELPFDEDAVDITKTPNLESLLEFPPELGRSEEAKDMVKKMLVRNPKKRWSIEQMRSHPWLNLPPLELIELVDPTDIRPHVLGQMRTLGFDDSLVVKALKQRYSTPATRIYSLLCRQNKQKKRLERVSTVVVGGQNPLQHQRREQQRLLQESISLDQEAAAAEANEERVDPRVAEREALAGMDAKMQQLAMAEKGGEEYAPRNVFSPKGEEEKEKESSSSERRRSSREKPNGGSSSGSSRSSRDKEPREGRDGREGSHSRSSSGSSSRSSRERHADSAGGDGSGDAPRRRALPAIPGESRSSERRSGVSGASNPPSRPPPGVPPPVPRRRGMGETIPAPSGPAPGPPRGLGLSAPTTSSHQRKRGEERSSRS